MFQLPSTRVRFLSLLAATLLVSALTAHAQVRAGVNRPATVPEGYLITPMGYFHASCVKVMGEGDTLHPDERAVYHKDGSFDAMLACAYPHFTARGEVVPMEPSVDAQGSEPPFIGHSWMVAVQTVTSSSYGEITSEFKVPPAPSSKVGQTIYFFPGMQDTHDVKTIIQPVLGWNADFANAWGISSWNCCTKGTVYESQPKPTATGHVIYGQMKDTCSAGTLSCGSWNILTKDMSTGNSTELKNSSSQHQTFNWGFGNVLEVYNVAKCSDYPAGGKLEAYDVNVYNDKFKKVAPSWSVWKVWQQPPVVKSPLCGYGGSSTATTATVKY